MDTREFWNNIHRDFKPYKIANIINNQELSPTLSFFYSNLVLNIKGKRILELGCGNGFLSVYLAKMGAKVIAIDISPVSVENTKILAKFNKVDKFVDVFNVNVFDIDKFVINFDIVVGAYILHHIEPLTYLSISCFQ